MIDNKLHPESESGATVVEVLTHPVADLLQYNLYKVIGEDCWFFHEHGDYYDVSNCQGDPIAECKADALRDMDKRVYGNVQRESAADRSERMTFSAMQEGR